MSEHAKAEPSGAMTTRRVTGAGLSLAVYEQGDSNAPTVVLVHGYPDTAAVWNPVARALASRYHVVAYDVRGAGASDDPRLTERYRLPVLMDDLAAVIDAVSPDAPVHLVGHDWGSLQGWEAVLQSDLAGRIKSYTSISGCPLDHARHWMRDHATARGLPALISQGLRSSYMALFNVPGVAAATGAVAPRLSATRRQWARSLHRSEGLETDDDWPAPTFGADLAHGMHLYKANVIDKLRHGTKGHTAVPVQMVVPIGDPFVPPALIDGLEGWADRSWRRDVPAKHWVVRSQPQAVARWIGELVDHVEGGPEPTALRRARTSKRSPDEGRVVVITGAGSGIGRATALAFASRGAIVVAADVDFDAARRTTQLVEALGGEGHAYQVDVADLSSMEAFAKAIESDVGVPDVVVNNAGIGVAGRFLDTTADDWDRILGINLGGVIAGSRLFGQQMVNRAEGGHLVNVASAAAFAPAPGLSAYGTTKAAVLQLTETLRLELATAGIGVSAICPGFVNTPIAASTHYAGVDEETERRLRDEAVKAYRRRNLASEVVADAIVEAADGDGGVVPVGAEAHVLRALGRLTPRLLSRATGAAGRTMDRRMR